MISLENLTKRFGAFTALAGISVNINKSDTTVILGPSGSGKSTLLRCLNLLEIPTSGTLRIDDLAVSFPPAPSRAATRAIRARSAMVFQSFNLFPHQRVIDNITLGPIAAGTPAEQARANALTLLERVGLAAKAQSYPSQLSGGQQQRVAIARALAMRPDYLLCDEPTSALDPELEAEVISVLNDLASQDASLVVVTHNMAFAHRTADRILFLADAQISFDATPDEFFEAPSQRIARFLSVYGGV